MSSGVIITPQAWVPVFLKDPSKTFACCKVWPAKSFPLEISCNSLTWENSSGLKFSFNSLTYLTHDIYTSSIYGYLGIIRGGSKLTFYCYFYYHNYSIFSFFFLIPKIPKIRIIHFNRFIPFNFLSITLPTLLMKTRKNLFKTSKVINYYYQYCCYYYY